MRLFAQLPAIVAWDQRRRRDEHLVEPRDDLGYSANFLHMTFGDVPELVVVNAFDVSMILYAEHSFNASTFTARVVTSTLSDLYSSVVAAIGALKGPLHGGANEAVMRIFEEIGDASNAAGWLDAALAEKRKIMGFGHRVYKHGDSRVPTMKAALDTLIEEYDRPRHARASYDALEQAMDERKAIKPNLDYPSGPAYNLDGLRHRDVHAAVRREPGHRLDRPHHGAARRQRPDPPAERVRRPRRAPRAGPDLPST